jgi:hypothetical protein
MGAIALIVAAATCGGKVVVHSGSPDGGAGGVGGKTPVADGGGGAAPECGRTNDRFDMALYGFDASEWGCSLGVKTATGTYVATGMVVFSDVATITVDSCPPSADCSFSYTTIDVAADGLTNLVPIGALVRVEAKVQGAPGCEHYLTIENLAAWEGMVSAVAGDHIWLAAGDGGLAGTASFPFDIAAEPLGCYPGEPAEDHLLRWSSSWSSSGSELVLAMGEEGDWHTGGTTYRARNLRAFENGSPGEAANWGWWLTVSSDFD